MGGRWVLGKGQPVRNTPGQVNRRPWQGSGIGASDFSSGSCPRIRATRTDTRPCREDARSGDRDCATGTCVCKSAFGLGRRRDAADQVELGGCCVGYLASSSGGGRSSAAPFDRYTLPRFVHLGPSSDQPCDQVLRPHSSGRESLRHCGQVFPAVYATNEPSRRGIATGRQRCCDCRYVRSRHGVPAWRTS